MIIWHFNEKIPAKKMFHSRKRMPSKQLYFNTVKFRRALIVVSFFKYKDEKKDKVLTHLLFRKYIFSVLSCLKTNCYF